MSKTDIFGKKPYREMAVKSAKPDLNYCCVLAIRSRADRVSFLKKIYDETGYFFSIFPDKFQAEEMDIFSKFQSFVHTDEILNCKVMFLQNTDAETNKQILGYDGNALFQIKKQKQKPQNQISLLLEEQPDIMDFKQEEYGDEIQNWYDFKTNLAKNSVNIMGKIDYIFPLRIETYEIVQSLLQHLPKMQDFNYMLLEAKQIDDAISFFMYMDLMREQIEANTLQSIFKKNHVIFTSHF